MVHRLFEPSSLTESSITYLLLGLEAMHRRTFLSMRYIQTDTQCSTDTVSRDYGRSLLVDHAMYYSAILIPKHSVVTTIDRGCATIQQE